MKPNSSPTRRQFLAEVGRGTLAATIGPALAMELGLLPKAYAEPSPPRLQFGDLEPLVAFLQESPLDKLQPGIVSRLQSGTSLRTLTAAAALANARSFGGEDYIGFHTFMALIPALRMSELLPSNQAALPVLKVLYRNTARIHDDERDTDVLLPVSPSRTGSIEALHDLIKKKDVTGAEQMFAAMTAADRPQALSALLTAVQDNPEVHRTVLPYRAWDMIDLAGPAHAHTLLRQSLRYCLNAERYRTKQWDEQAAVLTRVLGEHHLHDAKAGNREADDAWVKKLAQTFATDTPDNAAQATATALKEGFDPAAIGEAICLAASHLVLRDPGRLPQYESPGKPAGCVHGDSIGVHASDAANAWRNLARAAEGRHLIGCLVMGSWIIARDRGSSLLSVALPTDHLLKTVAGKDQTSLLAELESAIRDNQQAHATAIVQRMGELKVHEKPVFDLLLKYAVSEDGALHAEKYFHTVWDDFQHTRPSLRWQHLAALARVTASEHGRAAPGQEQARELLAKS